jgi:hypothetical protein
LIIPPAGGKIVEGFDPIVEYGAVPNGRSDHIIAAAAKDGNQRVEALSRQNMPSLRPGAKILRFHRDLHPDKHGIL